MKKEPINRRRFLEKASAITAGTILAGPFKTFSQTKKVSGELAILGGTPVHDAKSQPWPEWPWMDQTVEQTTMKSYKTGRWTRYEAQKLGISMVQKIETELPKFLNAKYVRMTNAGTNALSASVHALNIGAGDEVITSPYTDMGTIAAILTARALPVLADLNPLSYQLDPADVERKITQRTKAIMPVHIMGVACDMDNMMRIAAKHKLKVIEDSCQAIMATHNGKTLGTIGDIGCLSFQSSKVVGCGEGGAIFTNNEELAHQAYTVIEHGTDYLKGGGNVRIGPKYRMPEVVAAILVGQMATHKERHDTRNKNARFLDTQFKGFKGLQPQLKYGNGDGAYYHYAMTYSSEFFDGLPITTFFKAMNAEGIPIGGYIAKGLHKDSWIDYITTLPEYNTIFGEKYLVEFKAKNKHMPNCDRVCATVARLSGGGPLTAPLSYMEDFYNAAIKIYENRGKLKSLAK